MDDLPTGTHRQRVVVYGNRPTKTFISIIVGSLDVCFLRPTCSGAFVNINCAGTSITVVTTGSSAISDRRLVASLTLRPNGQGVPGYGNLITKKICSIIVD